MSNEFKCALCESTFKKDWTDEEESSYKTNRPSLLVCDDCYDKTFFNAGNG